MKTMILLTFVCLSTSTVFAGPAISEGVPNPASVNCTKLGGQLNIVTEPDGGQASYCTIDEWQLFKEMYQRGLIKPHKYGQNGMPNPAAVNCVDIGGEIDIVTNPDGGQAGYCKIEEWTLFKAINVTAE